MGADTKNGQVIANDRVKALNEFTQKIETGLKDAWRKLVIKSAEADQSLVIKVNGEIKLVPAKELLEGLEN